MDLLYYVYCFFAFPIWIAAISLPNSTSETNPNAVNRNITDNKVSDDVKPSVVLNTGNNSTESNLFPNLESSTIPRTANYTGDRDKASLDKDLLTKYVITEGSVTENKDTSFHTSKSSKTSTYLLTSTPIPEMTSRQLDTTEHNMGGRDIQPNNIYNISVILKETNKTTNGSTFDKTTNESKVENTTKENFVDIPTKDNFAAVATTAIIQNKNTKNNMTSQVTTVLQTTIIETTEPSSTVSSTTQSTKQHDIIKHTTEFAQNVPIGHHKKHKKPMHHLNLVPIEDGPFGSLIWKDKKYLISVLVPIGIGIIGAGCIIGMAYVVRFCQKTEQQVQRMRQALVEPKEERNDQIVLLVNSSDDDF